MCPGELTSPIRYLPVPKNETYHSIITNFTLTKGKLTANATQVIMPHEPQSVSTHPSFLIYYLFFAVIVPVILVLAYYYRAGIPVPTHVTINLGEGKTESIIKAIYEYTGIKKVLRKYYLWLREVIGCTTCTPREIALMSSDNRIYVFADVMRTLFMDQRIEVT